MVIIYVCIYNKNCNFKVKKARFYGSLIDFRLISCLECYIELALKLLSNVDFATTIRQKLYQATPKSGHAIIGDINAGNAILSFWKHTRLRVHDEFK
jgi:hypothetical protein